VGEGERGSLGEALECLVPSRSSSAEADEIVAALLLLSLTVVVYSTDAESIGQAMFVSIAV
jgi:hypothetical protein